MISKIRETIDVNGNQGKKDSVKSISSKCILGKSCNSAMPPE